MKTQLRAACLERLKKLPSWRHPSLDAALREGVWRVLGHLKPRRVLLYAPLSIEPDIRPLLVRCKRAGMAVSVPFMEEDSFKMVPYRLPLFEKKFGIKEPTYSHVVQKMPDVMVIPCVGMDKNYTRIGFGKGMYDRFAAKTATRWRRPKMIFTQRILCKSQKSVGESFDVKADFVVTSQTIMCIQRNRYGVRAYRGWLYRHWPWRVCGVSGLQKTDRGQL